MDPIVQFASPIRHVRGRHGDMIYNRYDHYVGLALEYYGEYCEHEVSLFAKLIAPTDVVWEIGANTGSQAVPLARLCRDGAYVGFEPQVELFKILTANLCLNALGNARSLGIALGETDGIVHLPVVDYRRPNNFGAVSLLAGTPGEVAVEIRRIDSLTHLPPPTFVKMDVEGMETMVLRGGTRTIAAQRPLMYVENDRPERSKELIEQLWSMGYALYWHITPYFNPDNFFACPENVYGATQSFNMLCLPKERTAIVGDAPAISDSDAHPLKA